MAQLNTRPNVPFGTGGAYQISMIHYVYILHSKDFDRFYIGMTANIITRLSQHNSGKTKSTKAFVPCSIIHIEEYITLAAARKREKYLKSAAGRRWRKNNIRPRGATE